MFQVPSQTAEGVKNLEILDFDEERRRANKKLRTNGTTGEDSQKIRNESTTFTTQYLATELF